MMFCARRCWARHRILVCPKANFDPGRWQQRKTCNYERALHTDAPTIMGWEESVNIMRKVAEKPTIALSLKDFYNHALNSSPNRLLQSAQYLHRELPIRIAKRLVDFQELPFLTASNPNLRKVYNLYAEAFTLLWEYPAIRDVNDETVYANTLTQFIDDHQHVVSLLAMGVKEARKRGAAPGVLDKFLDSTIRSRIGIRLLIEQQLALHLERKDYVGVIHANLNLEKMIRHVEAFTTRMCEDRYMHAPSVVIDGDEITVPISYIPVHLEYLLQELMKNAFRATCEYNLGQDELPPVIITIHANAEDFYIRISDRGGGIPKTLQHKCWSWSFTTADDVGVPAAGTGVLGMVGGASRDGPIAGLGFGLPMSKVYASYFGGDLKMYSMAGFGTDIYLRLTNLGPDCNRHMRDASLLRSSFNAP
eukprot:m.181489 g.181489  ORF g.181489 m.181489 type:complete len:420 (-) comp15514_c1_seq14:1687-2946(-)